MRSSLQAERALLPSQHDLLEVPTRYGGHCLIPMNGARIRLSGSRVYPGYRLSARVFRTGLRAWITLGGARLTHPVRRRAADGDWPLGELLRSELPALSTAAVAVGAGPDRKIVLQLMDRRGRILGFAKYADGPAGRTQLENEARMLAVLPDGIAPRLLRMLPFRDGAVLVQTALLGRPCAPRASLDQPQLELLQRLVRAGRTYRAAEHPFINALYAHGPCYRLRIRRLALELGDAEWPLAWMHGDFWFGNVYLWRGTCSVLDWEWGIERGFPYLDGAHWLYSVASMIQRQPPGDAHTCVSRRLAEYLPDRHRHFASSLATLSALSQLVAWYPRAQMEDDVERWLTAFVQASDNQG